MSRYKDIDLCTKIIKKEFSNIESSGVSMYKKGRRDGLVLANTILRDDKRIPKADAVEVVRCKDCKYYNMNTGLYVCNHLFTVFPMKPDDFCSRAERKDEE